MRPSDWPFRYKLLAVILFVGIMGLWALIWSQVLDWIPVWISDYLLVAGLSFCGGWLACEKSLARHARTNREFQRTPLD